uniref:Xanthine dehydrogenase, iron-sulfur cluster and FAD-binding subunit A n=1 Tax=uncultured Thiotrichaceae bacterium TaxID=298394 RepID=A0A6S6ULI7_9GAMM|nr:MAG: Xanthine dehydrogenase, iron-sulfur cluster and FAD-binding subunit A [uncultured Thiotrichaceae bacterium]
MTQSSQLRFLLNGKPTTVSGTEPDKSLLAYLREDQQLTGTKEGCAEGDCGACTVVVAELEGAQLELKTVNACMQFVPTLAGKAVFTVEYLRKQQGGALHPVQQAMVDHHGSQCGFCTPGFIMSLWNVYNRHQPANTQPERREIRSALTGNLCRCTGYKPILQAADAMFELPAASFNRESVIEALRAMRPDEALDYHYADAQFYAPRTIGELLALRSENPEATVLAGGTDVGLWVNKQFRALNPIIYLGEVSELKQVTTDNQYLHIGAGVTLTHSYQALHIHYPEMDQMWERFASQPIRNSGTLGGNIANGSPIGDSMPALIALGARVVLRSVRGQRDMALEDLYLDYMKKDMAVDEIVESITIPLPVSDQQVRCYKLSKRHDSDISAVFCGMAIALQGETIVSVRIAFGGMAATPKRAAHCERALVGQVWDESTVKTAMAVLKSDYSPLTDMRASDENRMQSAMNLLYRFYLETRPVDPLSVEMVNVY